MERCVTVVAAGTSSISRPAAAASPARASAASPVASPTSRRRRLPATLKAHAPQQHRRSSLVCRSALGDGQPTANLRERVLKDVSKDMRYLDGDLAEDEDSILGSASDVLNRTVTVEKQEEEENLDFLNDFERHLAPEQDPDQFYVLDFWETIVTIRKGPNGEYDFSEVYIGHKDADKDGDALVWTQEALAFHPVAQTGPAASTPSDTYYCLPWVVRNTVKKDNGSPFYRQLMNAGVDPANPTVIEKKNRKALDKMLPKMTGEQRSLAEKEYALSTKTKRMQGDYNPAWANKFDRTEEKVFKTFLIRERESPENDYFPTMLDYRQVFCVHQDGSIRQEEVADLHLLDDPNVGEPQLVIRPHGLTIQDVHTTPTADETIDALDRQAYIARTTTMDFTMPAGLERYSDERVQERVDWDDEDTWVF